MYTASALASGGKLFNTVFGLSYHTSLLIGAAVILAYTFMGGFLAVCTTDFIQGTLMLVALLTVPIIAYAAISGDFAGHWPPMALLTVEHLPTSFMQTVKNAARFLLFQIWRGDSDTAECPIF